MSVKTSIIKDCSISGIQKIHIFIKSVNNILFLKMNYNIMKKETIEQDGYFIQ